MVLFWIILLELPQRSRNVSTNETSGKVALQTTTVINTNFFEWNERAKKSKGDGREESRYGLLSASGWCRRLRWRLGSISRKAANVGGIVRKWAKSNQQRCRTKDPRRCRRWWCSPSTWSSATCRTGRACRCGCTRTCSSASKDTSWASTSTWIWCWTRPRSSTRRAEPANTSAASWWRATTSPSSRTSIRWPFLSHNMLPPPAHRHRHRHRRRHLHHYRCRLDVVLAILSSLILIKVRQTPTTPTPTPCECFVVNKFVLVKFSHLFDHFTDNISVLFHRTKPFFQVVRWHYRWNKRKM